MPILSPIARACSAEKLVGFSTAQVLRIYRAKALTGSRMNVAATSARRNDESRHSTTGGEGSRASTVGPSRGRSGARGRRRLRDPVPRCRSLVGWRSGRRRRARRQGARLSLPPDRAKQYSTAIWRNVSRLPVRQQSGRSKRPVRPRRNLRNGRPPAVTAHRRSPAKQESRARVSTVELVRKQPRAGLVPGLGSLSLRERSRLTADRHVTRACVRKHHRRILDATFEQSTGSDRM